MNSVDPSRLYRKAVREMKAYRSAREEYQQKQAVFMDANENPYGGKYATYPDPLQKELRAAFAAQKKIKANQLLFGNGSDEWIDLLIRTFCEAGEDELIYCPPTYGMYEVCAAFQGVRVKEVPQLPNFEIDTEAILKGSSDKSKLLFLCSPNNPTGKSIAEEQLRFLLENFRGMVVVDEAYIDFVPSRSVVEWLDQYSNLIVLQTFSKARGMAGIRLGVIYAQAEVIRCMEKVKLPYNVNSYSQELALESLEQRSDFRESTERLIVERERLSNLLTSFSCVEQVYPSDANFLLVKCNDAEALQLYLMEKGIIVRNRSSDLHCDNCLRISVGSVYQNEKLIKLLEAYSSVKESL